MTRNIISKSMFVFCVFSLAAAFMATGTFAVQKQVRAKKTCLMGECWKRINVNKLGEVGCPAPMLIVNNVLREMNGYLARRDELNLSESQVKELRLIKYRCHNTLIKKRAELNLLSIDLLDNMSSNEYDLAKVDDLTGKLKNTCHSMLSEIISKVIEARRVLTPEQRKKAKEIAL